MGVTSMLQFYIPEVKGVEEVDIHYSVCLSLSVCVQVVAEVDPVNRQAFSSLEHKLGETK